MAHLLAQVRGLGRPGHPAEARPVQPACLAAGHRRVDDRHVPCLSSHDAGFRGLRTPSATAMPGQSDSTAVSATSTMEEEFALEASSSQQRHMQAGGALHHMLMPLDRQQRSRGPAIIAIDAAGPSGRSQLNGHTVPATASNGSNGSTDSIHPSGRPGSGSHHRTSSLNGTGSYSEDEHTTRSDSEAFHRRGEASTSTNASNGHAAFGDSSRNGSSSPGPKRRRSPSPEQQPSPQAGSPVPSDPHHDRQLQVFIQNLLSVRDINDREEVPQKVGSVPIEVLENVPNMSAIDAACLFAEYSRSGSLSASVQLLEALVENERHDAIVRLSHRAFLHGARRKGSPRQMLRFLMLLPRQYADKRTFNLALGVCTAKGDLKSAELVLEMMADRQLQVDIKHRTQLIMVCAAAGNVPAAFKHYADARAALEKKERLDATIYGALIAACSTSMLKAGSDRKEQLVLLERAFGVVADAQNANVALGAPQFNALLACAGRCLQLQRAFEVIDMMQSVGVEPDATTYGTLIEACVIGREADLAMRVFRKAIAQGVKGSVQLYTAAIKACAIEGSINWDAALDVYNTMQRLYVEPDAMLYGNLIALAGRARKLDEAFELVEDMRASGLKPSTATCSALIYACIKSDNLAAARKVYDTLRARGVLPHISQYNALMEQYAHACKLGDVMMLLSEMIKVAGLQPNANTFRILLMACQRADQAELAFEVYQIMKARRCIMVGRYAQSMCYSLLKASFNRIRASWRPGGYPPGPPSQAAPFSVYSGFRPSQARRMLHTLYPAGAKQRHTYIDNADNINWVALAVATYRDFQAQGLRPHISVLDMLLACLRVQHKPMEVAKAAVDAAAANGCANTAQLLKDLAREAESLYSEERPYEQAFDRRALDVLNEAIGQGILPAFKTDEAFTVDMRALPPTVAEVYTLAILTSLEQRQAKSPSVAQRRAFVHPITLLLQPFDRNYIMWPSYVQKVNLHYAPAVLARQQEARRQAEEEARRAAHAARVAEEQMREFGEVAYEDHLFDDDYDGQSAYDHDAEAGTTLSSIGGAPGSYDSDDEHRFFQRGRVLTMDTAGLTGSEVTSLGVAATFRRLKAYAHMDDVAGVLTFTPREINRWVNRKLQYNEALRAEAARMGAAELPPGADPANKRLSLFEQQRRIRLGMQLGSVYQNGVLAAGAGAPHHGISNGNSKEALGPSPYLPGGSVVALSAAAQHGEPLISNVMPVVMPAGDGLVPSNGVGPRLRAARQQLWQRTTQGGTKEQSQAEQQEENQSLQRPQLPQA